MEIIDAFQSNNSATPQRGEQGRDSALQPCMSSKNVQLGQSSALRPLTPAMSSYPLPLPSFETLLSLGVHVLTTILTLKIIA
eukprot:1152507-Pelagomonas_calceolata.AAC.5